ncbi:MAG: DUF4340 domain-containing protein, partial [Candidatus Eisenbacteria bacterium]
MNPRMTALLAGVLLLLGGLAFFLEQRNEEAKAPSTDKLFPEATADAIDAIDLVKQGIETKMEKRNGTWIVLTENEKAADPKAVEELLADVDKLTNSDLVSTNKANHEVYEVGDTGVNVTFAKDGKDVAEFVVGKPGSDFNSSYIRPTDGDDVYRVQTYLRLKVDRGARGWRNKTLLDVPQEDILAFSATSGDTVNRFERDGAGWKATVPFEGKVIEPKVMDIVMNSLAKITATGFADTIDVATAGLEPPQRYVTVETADGKKHVIVIGDENPSRQTYTRVEGDDQTYLVPVGRWNTIFRKASEIAVPDDETAGDS